MKGKGTGDLTSILKRFADHVLHDTGRTPMIALGPLVWGIEPGHDTRHWYFVAASINASGEVRLDQFKIPQDNRQLAEQTRTGLMFAILQRQPPCVLSDFDDELALARWCEALAPSERTRRIRADIEQERETA